MNEDSKLKKAVLITSITLFVLSLTQKSFCTTSECSDSIMVLLLGWGAIFSDAAGMAWYANPLLFAAWWLLKPNLRLSMTFSAFAGLLSLSFLIFDNITDNEGGQAHRIVSHNAGYWLWLSGCLVMLAGTFVLMFRYNMRHVETSAERWSQKRKEDYM
ncbi:hypothetical protein I5907_09260 [Panacibacter sp. DH6]|uniref:Uncharacterized protein n=1 Tax=Panacibacter microcysteis TaxID=2793269 RepID=A0A931GVI5_9BACT|nr:hypothetical protein [Panacibacter microcysteis]MBG9376420.1 hypothetical protein [Panacibacter microcysteis]